MPGLHLSPALIKVFDVFQHLYWSEDKTEAKWASRFSTVKEYKWYKDLYHH